jgi:2-dehydro-3-deoxygluconokinase
MPGPIVCFGELLIRLTAPRRELLLQSPELELCVGGAEANVAVGLAHLGHATTLVSVVPDNPLGRGALAAVRAHGVDCRAVGFRAGRMGLYFLEQGAGVRAPAITYDRAGTAFAGIALDSFDWAALLADAARLHLSGITLALGPGPGGAAMAAAGAARRLGVPVSFDCNYRSLLWEDCDTNPKAALAEMFGIVDVLFGNHRDFALVLGRDVAASDAAERRCAASSMLAAFPNLTLVATTLRDIDVDGGHRLATRVDSREAWFETVPRPSGAIVDRIGAGDAFVAGVLHAMAEGSDCEAMARAGQALFCLKHQLPGDASRFRPSDIAAFETGSGDVRR